MILFLNLVSFSFLFLPLTGWFGVLFLLLCFEAHWGHPFSVQQLKPLHESHLLILAYYFFKLTHLYFHISQHVFVIFFIYFPFKY
ncbi:hypothetical protein QBC42DRAFT_56320 [Cladorrhinum samala]|uniref:Uncharacterized protein n=1 Tax=Cladorrhinum samala TaxID=585594 RepID=A0AAV9H7B7_9PEZI|nr:hypothetical protein QBC42DRAFT_56320 [Cladorrhinum samala]